MPPPKKLDLIPPELRQELARVLQDRGFGDIVAATEELNAWLEAAGLEIRIGKTAVGEYSKLLKDQREAYELSAALLSDMDIERESEMHKVLTHLISTMTFQLLQDVRKEDKTLAPSDLMNLGRMVKDLMSSTGTREKLKDDERQRIAKAARERAAESVEQRAGELGLSKDVIEQIKSGILGVSA